METKELEIDRIVVRILRLKEYLDCRKNVTTAERVPGFWKEYLDHKDDKIEVKW